MRWYWILELESVEIGITSKKLSYASSSSWLELYIYNFWPREGESIALVWGRLKSMLYSCPNHELSRDIIIHNFYARLSRNDQSMLDTSCTGSFTNKTIEFQWDLLERNNTTLKIGNSMKVKSQVLSLSLIVFNLLWVPMLFKSLALNMDLTLR